MCHAGQKLRGNVGQKSNAGNTNVKEDGLRKALSYLQCANHTRHATNALSKIHMRVTQLLKSYSLQLI